MLGALQEAARLDMKHAGMGAFSAESIALRLDALRGTRCDGSDVSFEARIAALNEGVVPDAAPPDIEARIAALQAGGGSILGSGPGPGARGAASPPRNEADALLRELRLESALEAGTRSAGVPGDRGRTSPSALHRLTLRGRGELSESGEVERLLQRALLSSESGNSSTLDEDTGSERDSSGPLSESAHDEAEVCPVMQTPSMASEQQPKADSPAPGLIAWM